MNVHLLLVSVIKDSLGHVPEIRTWHSLVINVYISPCSRYYLVPH